jgi:hypothetical protein
MIVAYFVASMVFVGCMALAGALLLLAYKLATLIEKNVTNEKTFAEAMGYAFAMVSVVCLGIGACFMLVEAGPLTREMFLALT